MRDVSPFTFTPDYQPHEGRTVTFELRPLDLATQWKLQTSMAGTGLPTWEAAAEVIDRCVVGWSGLSEAFSPKARRDVLTGAGDGDWLIWIGQITGTLHRRSMLSDDERKN